MNGPPYADDKDTHRGSCRTNRYYSSGSTWKHRIFHALELIAQLGGIGHERLAGPRDLVPVRMPRPLGEMCNEYKGGRL